MYMEVNLVGLLSLTLIILSWKQLFDKTPVNFQKKKSNWGQLEEREMGLSLLDLQWKWYYKFDKRPYLQQQRTINRLEFFKYDNWFTWNILACLTSWCRITKKNFNGIFMLLALKFSL